MYHLLEAKEMLAWALLEAHNVHHMQSFMAAARAAVARGGLAAFADGVEDAQPLVATPCAVKAPAGDE